MKKLFTCLVAILCSTSLWAQKDKDKEKDDNALVYRLDHKVLEGYTIKPGVDLDKDLSYWFISDEQQFDDMFQPSGEMGVTVKRPDFATQYVFAIACRETRNQTYLAFKKVEVVNEKDVTVHCVKMVDYKQNFKYVPVLIGTVPKTPFVKRIVFRDEDEKEQKTYSLDKIDREKQKIAEKQIKAAKQEKEKAEKEAKEEKERAEKEAKEEAARAEKEKKQAEAEKIRLAKEKADEEAYQAKELKYRQELAIEKAKREREKAAETKERAEREEREFKAQQEREEREARLEEERLKKEKAEAKLQAEEEARERAEIEKEKEEMRKEREERKAKRKEARKKAQEEDEE